MKLYQSIAIISLFGAINTGYAACTETTNTGIATKISIGHSWGKHSSEYVAGTPIANLKMPLTPKVTNTTEFKSHIISAMSSTSKKGGGGKTYWWLASTGTFVVHDPANVDCGSAFRPVDGKPYYDRQI